MNSVINCIIVEDEPVARAIIRNYCESLSDVSINGEFGNALDAKIFLAEHEIDLIFLDINMPVLSGINFLKTLRRRPEVIFTTAYHEYAVDAFDFAACDYLLKPFSLERFIIAVDKVRDKMQPKLLANNSTDADDTLFIKADGKIYKIVYRDCMYAEAQGNYTKIVTRTQVLLAKMPFSIFVHKLPQPIFCRIHRSFVINTKYISYIEGNRVFIQQKEIPIAANYKEAFFNILGI